MRHPVIWSKRLILPLGWCLRLLLFYLSFSSPPPFVLRFYSANEPGALELLTSVSMPTGITAMCLSTSYVGSVIFVATRDGQVHCLDPTDTTVTKTICDFGQAVSVLADLRDDTERVVCGGEDGRLVVLNYAKEAEEKPVVAELIGHAGRIIAVDSAQRTHRDDECLIVSAADDGAKVWKLLLADLC
jgi:hypothetical protein